MLQATSRNDVWMLDLAAWMLRPPLANWAYSPALTDTVAPARFWPVGTSA